MTGGTPEVRSHKSLTLLTFDIWHLIIWAFEHVNMWTFEHLNIWTLEHLNIWTFEHWDIGTLGHWNIGTFEHLNIGTLENWNIETLEHLNIWKFDIHSASISILWHQLHWYCSTWRDSCNINCIKRLSDNLKEWPLLLRRYNSTTLL